MQERRFIFFRGLYSTLDLFTDEIARVCRDRGYEYLIVHAGKEAEQKEEIQKFVKEPVTAAIGFGNMGLQFETEPGVSLWDARQIPYINVMMDHPFHFSQIFGLAPKDTTFLCPDENHVKYVKRFFPEIAASGFLPHPGKETAGVKKKIKDRRISVLYAGGLSRGVVGHMIPDFHEFKDFDADLLTQRVLQDMITHPGKTTEDAIEQYLLNQGIHYPDEELREVIRRLRFIDSYVTSFFREMTIKTLVENGIRVTLYGAGWEVCEWLSNPNLDYRGVVPAEEIPKLMADAKIVLNTMTWFKEGSHDRVFNGMLAGAAVVSDTSGYMMREFTNGKELYLFELERLGELPFTFKKLLADEDKLQQVADCGYECAKKNHRMENRFDTILTKYIHFI